MYTKQELYKIVFESDTKSGRLFDIVLIIAISLSVLVVIIDSIPSVNKSYTQILYILEWLFTILFTIEYFLRVFICPRPMRYIKSFWGIIDFLAVLPSYLSLFFFGYQYLLVVRIIRLLRVFRILKLFRFSKEAIILMAALKASSYKIAIFLSTVVTIVVLFGTVMYVVEGGENGFSSIPKSIYWAIITITTVGYGDIVPQTPFGQFIASITMIIGYAIIAVPTGIVTVEMAKASRSTKVCRHCDSLNDENSNYCKNCGKKFNEVV